MPDIHLADDVYFCTTRDGAVFLDLKQDEYLGVSASVGQVVCRLLAGDSGSTGPLEDADVQSAIANLREHGLLADMTGSASRTTSALASPLATMAELDPTSFDALPLHYFVSFVAAYARSKYMTRAYSLQRIVHTALRRKNLTQKFSAVSDPSSLRKHVTAFLRIRPIFFSAKDACLFDSLTLVNFLARYREFPVWVFGVKTTPFEAHSWVQQDDCVLNDSPERARAYSPILTI